MAFFCVVVRRGGRKPFVVDCKSKIAVAAGVGSEPVEAIAIDFVLFLQLIQ